jgi:ABC-type Mn2+/Zn2+ transport system ATPase subunit
MIELSDVEVRFGEVVSLTGINLSVDAGELVGIVGPSGAGKTTLLRLLLGEISPTTGRIELGTSGSKRRRSVGYVPQLEASERTFPLTVHGAVLLGAAATSARVPWFSRAEKAAASQALERLGIAELAKRGLHELSGGQFQRVLFARALVSDPDLVLLDEPTSGIDLATRAEMLTLVGELARDGLTVVLTTHDLNWVASHLPRIVCLNQTVRADGPPRSVLRPDVLASTFGADMAVIQHDGRPVVVDKAALVAGAR